MKRLAAVAAALALFGSAACTADPQQTSPEPTTPPATTTSPPPSASASPDPSASSSAGDYQTGSPDSPVPTTAAPSRPSTSPREFPTTSAKPRSEGVPRGQSKADAQVPKRDGDELAQAFAARLVEHDTRIDGRPADAAARAAVFATPPLAKDLAQRPEGQIPSWFTDLQGRDGWTVATTALGGFGQDPPDEPKRGWRAVTTTMTPQADNGWTGDSQTTIWALTLVRAAKGEPWQVSSFEVVE